MDKVKVSNDHDKMMKRRAVIRLGIHEIVRFENGKYVIKDENGIISKVHRSKIDQL